ncbi:hypothetical protein C3K47_13735 [Solitalea longa]|uniref:Lipid/polyisoprenoid-binding YceI-like domain-containing protein n=1 Tax=Solitalea longa TaxID=2079460 RepID=A0A2S4ZZM1_9SPHI|nr:hypothetical protein [Solitalea longa]POY35808.1 hypothetical protein C3K47_13735 [Solitalea longa]
MLQLKRILAFSGIVAIFLLCVVAGNAQQVLIKVLPESSVKIKGKTSLCSYTFKYKGDLARDFKVDPNFNTDQLIAAISGLQLEVEKFKSGNFLMDKDFRKVMKCKEFPDCKIELLSLSIINNNPNVNGQAKIAVTIAGVKKVYLIPYQLKEESSPVAIHAIQPINFKDFGLNPKVNKLIEVKETCDVMLDLLIQIIYS